MESFLQDIRYGIRMLASRPGFTAVAALSLALGIGANTTIFSIINAILLTPVPGIEDTSRLAMVFTTDASQQVGGTLRLMQMSYPNYKDIRDQNDVFEQLAAFTFGGGTLVADEGEPYGVAGFMVSGNYFDTLGVEAALGRTFLPEEDETPGTHLVMVISHGLWERQFGSDPNVIGKTLGLNGTPFTVIGVAPEGFQGTFQGMGADLVWTPMMTYQQILPLAFRDWPESRRALLMNVFGRLRPGVTVEQADAAIRTIAARLESEYPEVNTNRGASVTEFTPLFNPQQEQQVELIAIFFLGIVGAVLLIACVNVANLLLARAATREKEIGLRIALGAGRTRLIRQLLTESTVLAVVGGVLGLLFAIWGRDLLWSFRPPGFFGDSIDLSLDGTVLLFTAGIALATGLVFGLVPALQTTKPSLTQTLHEGGRGGGGGRRQHFLRNSLVVVEVALSLCALIGAGLFVRSMQAAQEIDTGFEMERLASMGLNPGGIGYEPAQADNFFDEVLERVRGVGGVEAAALATNPPLGGGLLRTLIPEGWDDSEGVLTSNIAVSPGYFETMEIPLLRGRDFTEFDTMDTPQVAIINEAAQRFFWPDEDPIGRRYHFITEEFQIEVIGVVRDTVFQIGQDPQPVAFVPFQQRFQLNSILIVRTEGDPEAALGNIQDVIRAIEPNMPINGVNTIRQALDNILQAPRMAAALLGIFGLLALGLAMVGIYGVTAYSVSQRTREIGIRMALGAREGTILSLVLRQGMVLVVIGIGVGAVAALFAMRLAESMLFGISTSDPITFAGVSLLLLTVALVANLVPARRVMRIDPVNALKSE
jgi:predicted permease